MKIFRLTMLTLCLVVWAAVVSPPMGWAQSTDRIEAIKVDGNRRVEETTVLSYMNLRVGDRHSRPAVNRALKALFRTGLFADVTIKRDGTSLVVTVVENPIINRIAFEGNKRIDDEVLQQVVGLRPRVVFTRSRVREDVEKILQIYRRNGRFATSVDPKVIRLAQNRVDLIFEVNEGPLTGVRKIDFVGNRFYSDSRLQRILATKEDRWYRFLSSDTTYDPDRMAHDRDLLRRFYTRRGHADFRVISAVAELSRNREEFFITYTIDEGPEYRFGKVSISSSLPNFKPKTLKIEMPVIEGETYNAKHIEDSVQNLTFAVGEKGYAFVDVLPKYTRNQKTKVIDVDFQIKEGPRTYVKRINISGNIRTLDEIIRRQFEIVEGDAFNAAKLRQGRRRISNLGFFENVKMRQKRGQQEDHVIVDLEVSERSTGELSFGFGISSAESVVGEISIRERNLLGRGQDLRASISLSAVRQQIDIAFTEPYFMDRDIAAGFDLFSIEKDLQDRSSFDRNSDGFTLRAGFGLTRKIRQRVHYTLRNDEVTDVSLGTSPLIAVDSGKFLTSEIGYTLRYDTRDSRFLPTEGIVITGGQDLAGLGGDVKYLRTRAAISYFYQLDDELVANFSFRTGYINGLGDNVSVLNRFFLGGDRLRGFDSGGVGPRDVATNDSIGGNFMYAGTAALRFPMGVVPKELGMVGRIFIDVGSLTGTDVSNADLRDSGSIRAAAGFGISWSTPLGPIRLDFTEALLNESYDDTEFFRFSFGTRF